MGKEDQVLKMLADEQRVVTAKYCAHRLHISIAESKKVLESLYQDHNKEGKVVPIFAVNYRYPNDENEEMEHDGNQVAIERYGIKLVVGTDFSQEGLPEDVTNDLYALAPHHVDDVASLCYSTDALCMRQMLNDDPHCFAQISCPNLKMGCSSRPPSSTSGSQSQSSSAKNDAPKPNPLTAASKPSKDSQKEAAKKTAEPNVKKETAPPPAKSASNFFGSGKTSKKVDGDVEEKPAVKKEKKAEEEERPKATAVRKSKGKEHEKAAKVEEESPKAKTSSKKKVDDDEDETKITTKKTKHRRVIEDDDDDDEHVKESSSKSKAKDEDDEELLQMAVDDEEEEKASSANSTSRPGTSNAVEEQQQQQQTGTGARKLVERTYVDDEGYFVTEKTWSHDNGSAPAAKPVAAAAAAAKPQPASKPAPSKAKVEAPSSKGKQTSLTSFFKKA